MTNRVDDNNRFSAKLKEIESELYDISPVFTEESLQLIYAYCITLIEKLNSERTIKEKYTPQVSYTYFKKQG